jgi:hypothetical protein
LLLADRTYVAHLIAAKTGMSEADAGGYCGNNRLKLEKGGHNPPFLCVPSMIDKVEVLYSA